MGQERLVTVLLCSHKVCSLCCEHVVKVLYESESFVSNLVLLLHFSTARGIISLEGKHTGVQ